MRSTARRCLAVLGIAVCASGLGLLATAAPAHAGTCYEVQIGNIEGVTVCP
jgi:hypothetical protein